MANIKVEYEIPEKVKEELRALINYTIKETLTQHAKDILTRPRKLTRKETAQKLRISLPTLLSYESQGLIKAERIGRRVLFREDLLEQFLSSTRPINV